MPRPAIGKAARTEMVSVRLTEKEVAELTRQYGSAGKGLRALLAANRGRPTAYSKVGK